MKQKIIKVGNSLAITIPKSFIEKTGYKAGDEIIVTHDDESKTLVMTVKDQAAQAQFHPEFFIWLRDIKHKYKDAIKELAKQ